MNDVFKYLIIADESPEFPAALAYVAYRAKQTGGDAIVMLHVVEPPEPSEWVSISEEIRRQATEAAEALTQRFIDRRTSALLKGLKREEALLAGISEEGEVTVEGHFVGRLEGLEFQPDPRASAGLEGRAVRNAALKALRPEASRRLAGIAAAADEDIALGRDGRVRVDGAVVARLG